MKLMVFLDQIKQTTETVVELLQNEKTDIKDLCHKMTGIWKLLELLEKLGISGLIPTEIYGQYQEFFSALTVFCGQCGDEYFLRQNKEQIFPSLQLLRECIDELQIQYTELARTCPCCGRDVIYAPLPQYYSDMQKLYPGVSNVKPETLNKEKYLCPNCGASDRDRLIVSFLDKAGLKRASEGTRLLQVAPAKAISAWIESQCPNIEHETTDLYMDGVSFRSDIMNMNMVDDETYDVIVCSHVLEHVQDDRQALQELRRILKPDGKILFLVPVDLNTSEIDEEWGLSEAENWRRFGQGDHCRRYGKSGLLHRLEEQFYVHCLGVDFFGQDIFEQCGLTDTSMLYVLTKSDRVKLDLEEEMVVDDKLCREGPLVSVIMPCYNHESFVAEAIESVINQSYKNIEFIVADDASTDNTAAVMKRYSSYFTKEFYYKENACGQHRELYQYARGKYIALMHSDDVWEKDKLALQVAYMEDHEECGACLTWCQYTNENLEELDSDFFFQPNRSRYEWMRFFWQNGNVLCNPSSLCRREVSLKMQKYGSACRQIPDFFKWISVIEDTSIHIIPQILIKMRRYQRAGVENTSADTDENVMRHNVEEGCNWLWVIRDMDSDFFKKSFGSLMINPQAESEPEIKCEKYFLMLSHSNYFVQNSAFCYFHEIHNDEIKKCMADKYNYTRKDLAVDTVSKGIAGLIKKNQTVRFKPGVG